MRDPEIGRFCEESGIDLLVLFGSSAGGRLHPASDLDVAVKLRTGATVSKLELIGGLGDLFEGKEIDLVVLTRDTDPLLLYEIFSRGKPLYEGHSGVFDREKLRAWKLYLDTEGIRLKLRNYLKEFAEKFGHVA
ncbi:MAG TPA: nucleotidyltransferase domain-containing protein, partial [Thermodesulfovibrionales bacterium]|nr:nucleotidyltransferase domain-containing protein [Thermodesulfovibrionales bacterium]